MNSNLRKSNTYRIIERQSSAGPREMAHRVNAFTALAGHLSLVPRAHVAVHNHWETKFQDTQCF